MKFTLTSNGAQLAEKFRFTRSKITLAALEKMNELLIRLQAKIVGEKLSGQVLARRSGTLADSVQAQPSRIEGYKIIGEVDAAGGEASYGWVHEYGGTKQYAINPVNKKALRMLIGGKAVFAAYAFRNPLPQRSWLRSSLDEMASTIQEELRQAVVDALNQ